MPADLPWKRFYIDADRPGALRYLTKWFYGHHSLNSRSGNGGPTVWGEEWPEILALRAKLLPPEPVS